jgi:hypothetical protein
MTRIIGNTTATPNPRPDWNQTDSTKADFIKNKPDIDGLTKRVSDNEDAIETLNGTGDGSVDKKINDAFNDFATNVSNDATVNTYKELIDYAATHGKEFTELVGVVDDNTDRIDALEEVLGSYINDIYALLGGE